MNVDYLNGRIISKSFRDLQSAIEMLKLSPTGSDKAYYWNLPIQSNSFKLILIQIKSAPLDLKYRMPTHSMNETISGPSPMTLDYRIEFWIWQLATIARIFFYLKSELMSKVSETALGEGHMNVIEGSLNVLNGMWLLNSSMKPVQVMMLLFLDL